MTCYKYVDGDPNDDDSYTEVEQADISKSVQGECFKFVYSGWNIEIKYSEEDVTWYAECIIDSEEHVTNGDTFEDCVYTAKDLIQCVMNCEEY